MFNKDIKVVVTGLGVISSLGSNFEQTWRNVVDGKNGVSKITLFDASDSLTKVAAEVKEDVNLIVDGIIPKRILSQMTRANKLSYVCAKQAVEDSNINMGSIDKERVCVILGTSGTGFTSSEYFDHSNYILKNMINSHTAWISIAYKLKGPNFTVNTACASASYASGIAYNMIKNNEIDVAIVGGVEAMISKLGIDGFNELMALSEDNNSDYTACRPFDKNRSGFVMGEGAGVLIIESMEHALKRGARIYCEFAGYEINSESYNIVAPERNGEGMAKVMSKALENVGISPEEVDYINAHGTSTVLNDVYETRAIKKVFGKRAYDIPVSSTKSMLGHTLGAAGAVEGAVTVKSIQEGIVTPTINYTTRDPDCDLDYVPNKSRKHDINIAISNSFGFGGHNSVLVFKKCTCK